MYVHVRKPELFDDENGDVAELVDECFKDAQVRLSTKEEPEVAIPPAMDALLRIHMIWKVTKIMVHQTLVAQFHLNL
ncbi:hypothetical protein C5167_043719 [Papaver somniferum]|uniref:Uncharacterized protein n=1 Tax=Papaver somniferum TaxID=3469 RepID=A0A4Y7L7I1_PAPSO|nr:hypothetical protein C5167_043719 [Papaver somniferum]